MSRRIAIISPNYHPRTCGVGDHTMRIGAELQRRGEAVRVYSRGPVQPHPEAPHVEAEEFAGRFPFLKWAAAAKSLERWKPRLVIIQYVPHMLEASRFGNFTTSHFARRMRAIGAKVIVVGHELYLPWYARPDLVVAGVLHRAQLATLLASVDRFVVSTETRLATLRRFASPFGLADRLGLAPIGANASPITHPRIPGRFRMGIFSTLAREKRFDIVLEAFGRVAARLPDAELRLIGDLGEDSPARRALLVAVAEHPAAARIQVTGKLSLQEVSREVANLDAFLFPIAGGLTTRSGTLPLALGSGVPVVGVRGMETGSLFVDGENAIFADALSGAAFADAVVRLQTDRGLAERVSLGARRTFERALSWSRIVDQVLGEARDS